MARHIQHSELATRTARLNKLDISGKPYWVKLGDGLGLGYRRKETAGAWIVRGIKNPKLGTYWEKAIGTADDYGDADPNLDVKTATTQTIMTFNQAQDRARAVARGGEGASATQTAIAASKDKPITAGEALDAYADDQKAHGKSHENVRKVKREMEPELRDTFVSFLTKKQLRKWRDDLAKRPRLLRGGKAHPGGKPVAASTVNRACTSFKAALNLAAANDERITNTSAWKYGLAGIRNATKARNVILDQDTIGTALNACYQDPRGPDLGQLSEACAETGQRVSQIARCEPEDVTIRNGKAMLNVPVSRKGQGEKQVTHVSCPISLPFAIAMKKVAKTRQPDQPLFCMWGGKPWGKSDHSRPFKEAVARAQLTGRRITIGAFRHSSIVRQIFENRPLRLIAADHDTSVGQIERHYSREIQQHADAVNSRTLPDFKVRRLRVVASN